MYLVKRLQRDAPTAGGVLSTTYCQTKVRNIYLAMFCWHCDLVISSVNFYLIFDEQLTHIFFLQ